MNKTKSDVFYYKVAESGNEWAKAEYRDGAWICKPYMVSPDKEKIPWLFLILRGLAIAIIPLSISMAIGLLAAM